MLSCSVLPSVHCCLVASLPRCRWDGFPITLIIGGLLVLVPSTALLGYASSVMQLTILRLIQGIGSGAVAAPAFAVAADLAQSGGEGRQMSIVTMGFGLGIALGPLLAGILAVYSFTLPFNIGALFTLISAWVIYRYIPETVQRGERLQEVHSMAEQSVDGPAVQ